MTPLPSPLRRVRSRILWVVKAFTLVEVLITIGVAGMLLAAVAMFLVSGNVATKKVTNINQVNTKGRFAFDHISREMSLALDLKAENFQVPNPDNNAHSRLVYRINLGLPGTTAFTLASSRWS